jgi:hypothetical protein
MNVAMNGGYVDRLLDPEAAVTGVGLAGLSRHRSRRWAGPLPHIRKVRHVNQLERPDELHDPSAVAGCRPVLAGENQAGAPQEIRADRGRAVTN